MHMKQFLIFIRKEFIHILRDRRSMLILFGMPVIQIILFGFALTNELKNAKFAVLDYAQDADSRALIQKIDASRYFAYTKALHSFAEIEQSLKKNEVKWVMVFPKNFSHDLYHQNQTTIQLIADATDPNSANTILNYVQSMLIDYQMGTSSAKMPLQIKVETRMLYNPQLLDAYNFVPGVMAMVLILISAMMTSIAIVREKELGTMEVLLASPTSSQLIILSKVIPYLILSLVNVFSILAISFFALGMPIQGNLLLVIFESLLYISVALALGTLISTVTQSQQTAMTISIMALMMPTLMLTGYLFPIENMPIPLQIISNFLPAKWYIIILKDVMIKGLGLMDILKPTLILILMTIVLTVLSIRNVKQRLS